MKTFSRRELPEIGKRLRVTILKMVHNAKCGHFGGPLSSIDLLVALMCGHWSPESRQLNFAHRDRFVMSVGHACAALYAVLAEIGWIPKEELMNFRKMGSPLQGHPKRNLEWGIEMSTGSLGQGLSIGNGMALAARLQGSPARVYSLESDGGSQEGMVWEALMTASHYKLNNRCILIDNNNVQIDGYVKNVMGIEPFDDKLKSFGWHVMRINGHDYDQILEALAEAEAQKQKPSAILADTTLGKGVSIFENKPQYHGVAPSDAELATALSELGALS